MSHLGSALKEDHISQRGTIWNLPTLPAAGMVREWSQVCKEMSSGGAFTGVRTLREGQRSN
jgi:hypothetical protein